MSLETDACYASTEYCKPGDEMDNIFEHPTDHLMEILEEVPQTQRQIRLLLTETKPPVPEDGMDNPRQPQRT